MENVGIIICRAGLNLNDVVDEFFFRALAEVEF